MTATSRLNTLLQAHHLGRIDYERVRDEFGLALISGEMSPVQLIGMATCAYEDGLLGESCYADLATRLTRVMKTAFDEPEGHRRIPSGIILGASRDAVDALESIREDDAGTDRRPGQLRQRG